MNELSILTFSVLGGILAMYLVVFWVARVASICRSYLHDGEKDFKAFFEAELWLKLPSIDRSALTGKACFLDVMFMGGYIHPISCAAFLGVLACIDSKSGLPITPVSLSIIISIYVTLRVSRGVIRIKKRFDAHEIDKEAHKS